MSAAFAWGALAASSLLIGGLIALWFRVSGRVLGLILGFGAGVLISAVAYELVEDTITTLEGGTWVAAGLSAGALVYFGGDELIDRQGGEKRKSMGGEQEEGTALAIVLGIVLDGIPESVVIGLTLLEGGGVGVAMLVAVFLSNLPEAIGATSGLAVAGWKRLHILGLWTLVILASGLAAFAGYGLFGDASPNTIAFVLAFAGGAILTMLAETMIPEAYLRGGKAVGLVTTLGFGVAFAVSALD
ncbi:MAG TPA: ZIP family zinc transporter [Gemmatimonadota bacterium]|nr:ZIP family zinc transporter [Gemmatimonadota bacterium]